MAIKTLFLAVFDLSLSIVLTFRLPPRRCVDDNSYCIEAQSYTKQ